MLHDLDQFGTSLCAPKNPATFSLTPKDRSLVGIDRHLPSTKSPAMVPYILTHLHLTNIAAENRGKTC